MTSTMPSPKRSPSPALPSNAPLPRLQPARRPGVKHISLALQGGGSHGAFTWGVMHRLMSEPRLYIDGISGTSAGAMNAVVFTDGFIKSRRQGAINALAHFWDRVADLYHLPRSAALAMPSLGLPFGLGAFGGPANGNGWQVDRDPAFMAVDFLTRIFAPTQFNPLNINPLREVLEDVVDFEGLRAHPQIKLFVTASNVRTCKSRVFRTPEITVDTLMASACLPLMFKAVEIEGEHYWDGGYLGNPAIYPLIHECASRDVVIVQINPMNRPDVPVTARDILNRINEMTFNASLVREMFGVATITSLVENGSLQNEHYAAVRFHQIGAEAELAKLGALSKLNTERAFLEHLHQLGYDTADKWVEENIDRIGWESTIDLAEKFA
ncbi:alpha/beta hydrolase [Hypericibacter adhaerens]|uniref:Alpha/beta hydrolase n=1 Tax=Hypericibacter adhaerens TaxID=2602016 RepID=A0A5J6N330_9PROT|nr:patatin-like phospholipase family protein [Hypericibacter adhaerens]QEX23405.1 alpha/beta hydrolase [Hypericibacter adhaerens]